MLAADAPEFGLGDADGLLLVANAPSVKNLVGDGQAGAAVGLVFAGPIQELPSLAGIVGGSLSAASGEQTEHLVDDGSVNILINGLGLAEVALEAGAEDAELADVVGVALPGNGALFGVEGIAIGVEGLVYDGEERVALDIASAEDVEGGFGGGAGGGTGGGRGGGFGSGLRGCGGGGGFVSALSERRDGEKGKQG